MHLIRNEGVGGSNPSCGTTFMPQRVGGLLATQRWPFSYCVEAAHSLRNSSATQPPRKSFSESQCRDGVAINVTDTKRLSGSVLVFHDPMGHYVPRSLSGLRESSVLVN